MNAAYVNELGIAIVGRDEQKLSNAAVHLSAMCSSVEIKKVWKTVQAELTSKDIVWVQSALSDKTQLLELSKPLSVGELKQKELIETSFCEFLNSFAKRGDDLMYLRDNKLYRNEYPSWETYCQFKLGISYRHAHRLIEAAIVVNQLKEDEQTILPASESIAREIGKVKAVVRPLIWETVISKSEEESEPITAKFVSQVIKDYKPFKNDKLICKELSIGELVEIKKGKAKCWGQITGIDFNQIYTVFNGFKELNVSSNKISKLLDNTAICNRIMKLHKSDTKLIKTLGSTFHSVFSFEDWHLEILKILEAKCYT